KPITSTVTATNRAYDGTKNVAVSSLTLEGVETADKTLVTVTGGSEVGTVTDANVGENKPVTLSAQTYSLTGTKAKNYALTQPANPKVTITAAPYTYEVTTPQSVEKYSLPGILVAPATGDGILEETVPGTHKWYTTEACDVERTEQLTENVTLYCKFTPDGTNTNHVTTPTVQAVAVKLVKIPVTVTGVTVENHIYGSEVMPTGTPTVKKGDTSVTIAPENLVYTYTGTGETSYPANTTKPKEVGSYQLVVSLNDPDYVGTMTATAFQITPKPVTAAVTATERVYNGQKTVAVSTTATVSGAAYGDVLTAAGTATGTMENADAGKDKPVTLSAQTYVLAGTKAKNYTLTQPTGTVVTITPALYTYTIADADKTREVDKLTLPETLTAPNAGKGVGEETVPGSYEWFTDAGGTKKATEPLKEDSILYCKFTPTAKETVSGNKNYVDTPTIVPVTVLLNKLTVTITGELPATFTYPDPITPPTKVVVKREEKVVNPTGEYVYTFEGRESTTYGPTIVPPTDPGKYNLTIKLIGDPDYQGESGKFPFEIKPKTLTVSVTATHKVYDGNTTVAVTAGPLVGAKPGDDVKLTGGAATGTAADKNVGTDKAVTLTGYTLGGKKAGNYTLTPPFATVNITAAPFTYEVPTTQTVQTGTTKTGLVAPSTGTGVGEETVPGTSKWYKDPGCTTEITEPFTTEVTVYHKFVPNVTDPNKNYVGQPVTPVRVIVTEKDVVTITDPGITTEYTGEVLVDPVPTVSPALVGDPTWVYTYTGTDGSGKAYGPSTVRPTLVGEYRVTIKVTTETQQGEASFPFQITPAPLTVPGIIATGTPGETRVTLVNTGAVLTGVKAPDEGEVSLVSDKATGTVLDGKLGSNKTVTCVDYAITGEKAFCYTLTQPGYVKADITGDLRIGTVADEAYTGNPLTPKPTVWFGKLLLTPGTDYNEPMTYTGNTAVGQAKIEVTGKGAFAGKTAETVFQITKVTPNGTPFYEGTVKEGDTLADLHIGTGAGKRFTHPTTGTYVPGTVIWVDDKGEALPTTTPVTKGTAYRWKFTPTDGTNYEGTAGKAIPKLVGNPYVGIVVLSDAPTLGVPGANVRLVKGSTVFAETVSTVGGRFRFEAVPDGTYNIIGEKDVVGKLRTVTALVTITGGKPDLSTLILPNAEVSAVIETAPGQGKDKDNNPIEIKTPDVVVGGLETPTEELDKRITVKLTVRAKDEKTADQTAMAEIAVLKTAMAKDKTLGLVLDMDIVKRTTTISGGAPTTTTTEAITETDDLLEILIPLPQELQGKGTYIILRHHEGEGAISISESPNAAGEYLTLNSARDLITLHARKFSTYAVYSGAAPYSPDPGTGTGTKSKLVVVDAKGGKLTADPAAPATGETVTITVATEKGYFLEKLLVTGPDGVAVAFRSNGDGTYSFPMPKGRTKVTAEYKKASPANTGVAEKLITDDHILYLIGDDLGTFRPEANMNRAEVAQMFFRLMKNPEQLDKTAKLADVPAGAWYAGPVNAMVNAGIFTGYVDGSFRPEAQITRAEFVAVAARFAKANPGAVRFTDLPKEHWAFSAIATAVAYGWVDGYEDGSFKPGANITRSEVTKIVNAMLGRAADKAFVDAGNGLRLFPDADKSHWAFYEIVEATNKHNFKLVNDSETWSK
ncbi:MAG: YDG domain-containing protein, partial [Pseudoflavonifractor sp.]